VFNKKLKKGDLDPELYKETYLELMRAVKQGLGYDADVSIGYRDNRFQVANRMRSNIFTFAAFKNHSNIVDLVDALKNGKGQMRSWSKFKQAAQKISQKYNRNWLQAEWQTAKVASESSLKWEKMYANKDVLPYLQYKTQNDSLVRQSHMQLHNITRPLDDPFWDEFFPPNGWRCRCYTLQTGEPGDKVEIEGSIDEKEFPPAFRNNPGKTAKIYSDDHPYLSMVDAGQRTKVRNAYQDILAESDLYEVTSVEEIDIPFHVTHPVDKLSKNLGIAYWLQKRHQLATKLAPVKRNQKNPDALTADGATPVAFKQTQSVTGIKSRLKNAAQKADIVAIEISEVAPTAMKRAIGEFFRNSNRVNELYINYEDQSYLIRRGSYLEDLKQIR
jgi:SPP1 gp7 family putative phage head morphogenesis protein